MRLLIIILKTIIECSSFDLSKFANDNDNALLKAVADNFPIVQVNNTL